VLLDRYAESCFIAASSVGGYDTSMAEDSGFRDIKRNPKPGWERWRRPPPDRWERLGLRMGIRGKTAWDWLDLLIVPMMLALFAAAFASFQFVLQTLQEDARQQAITEQTAHFQRLIEESRAQEASLQNYLALITNLLMEHHLGDNKADDKVTALARAQTLTTLRKMDPQGKRTIVLFLSDAGLISAHGQPIISLVNADFTNANLIYADLSDADLSGAALSGANLSGANLSGADLEGTQEVTDEQLAEARSLEGATMPNGQKYADWLKDKEDGKNE
jgi:hypothetical protein